MWALEHFKHYLYGHYFTVQTDHRALLSILKEKSTKAHQSRLTRWCDRLIPFHFQIEHIPGSKMELTDYISRNPNYKAKPICRNDEDFVIAQIDAIKQTIYAIRQRGRPRKTDKLESSNHSKALTTKPKIKRQRGRPRKLPLQSQDDSKIKVPRAQSHKTKPTNFAKAAQLQPTQKQRITKYKNNVTIDDATLQKVTQQNIAKAHLPSNLATDKSPPNSNSNFEMDKKQPTIQQTPPTSPAKNPISFPTYLSPDKEDRPTKADTQLDKAIRDVFSSTLIAAMKNRDAVQRTNDSPTNPNLANLLKVNRTKIPPKRKFLQSPKKGTTGAKSQRTPTPPDSPFEDEDYEAATQRQETLDNSEVQTMTHRKT